MSVVFPSPYFDYNNSVISEAESKELSKQRIIQKNLVHFQGFPDRLYNKDILASEEYFGQYGLISKIILTNKTERKANKKSNSAYITFYSPEQASYAILSVDSIKIDDMLVRAFFGTTKYCNHFLNNFRCFNSEKCMFLHEIADPNDIITEESKFGYSEHIKLAKIINNNDIQSTSNSFQSNYSNDNNIINENNDNKDLFNNKSTNINNSIFKFKTKSRFDFVNNNDKKNENKDENKNKSDEIPKIIKNVLDELCFRLAFFSPYNKYIPLKNLELEFCKYMNAKTKNDELKNIITNSF